MLRMNNSERKQKQNAPKSLLGFAQECSEHQSLRDQVSKAKTPEEVISLAKQAGFFVTIEDLFEASRDLAASYWPWTGQSRNFRKKFFSRSLS